MVEVFSYYHNRNNKSSWFWQVCFVFNERLFLQWEISSNLKLQKKLFESKYLNFLWNIKILKTKYNYLMTTFFTLRSLLSVSVCVYMYINWSCLPVHSENKKNKVSLYLLRWWECRRAATENESPTAVVTVREKSVPAPGHIQT